jgi:hypothetical protein
MKDERVEDKPGKQQCQTDMRNWEMAMKSVG